jgi:hypothetical protein
MKRRKKICQCGLPSLPGLMPGVALCQYHYTVKVYGKEWADKCRDLRATKR